MSISSEITDLRSNGLSVAVEHDLVPIELLYSGLTAALAHRPELLLLDEPPSGLDPIVRRDVLGALLLLPVSG